MCDVCDPHGMDYSYKCICDKFDDMDKLSDVGCQPVVTSEIKKSDYKDWNVYIYDKYTEYVKY